MQLADSAAQANAIQHHAKDLRAAGAFRNTASSAIGTINANPNTNPPCRLAHSVISGSNQGDGDSPRSAAAIKPPAHATSTGSASTCGRANRCAAVNTSAPATIITVDAGVSRALRNLVRSAKATATAPAASTTGPVHPATLYASAKPTCANHCVEIQGCPAMVKE